MVRIKENRIGRQTADKYLTFLIVSSSVHLQMVDLDVTGDE